jgi:hypothetical protein
MPVNDPARRLAKFVGLRTQDDPYEVGMDAFVLATNVDVTRQERVRRRQGYTKRYNGVINAGWSDATTMLFLEGNALKRFELDFSATTLRSGLTQSNVLAAHFFNGRIYWSNGFETGVVDHGTNRSLGVTVPTRSSYAIDLGTGDLPVGIYKVSVTNVDTDDRESGAALPNTVSIMDGASLQISGLSNAYRQRIYISERDGSVPYFAAEIAQSDTAFEWKGGSLFQILERMHLRTPPAFTAIDHYNGRMLYAHQNILFFSNPLDYETIDFVRGYVLLDSNVTAIGVVTDGIFIGTDKAVYFLEGGDFTEGRLRKAYPDGALLGGRTYVPGKVLGSGESEIDIPVMTVKTGFVLGLPGGDMKNVTGVEFTAGYRATTAYRRHDGQNHLVSIVRT